MKKALLLSVLLVSSLARPASANVVSQLGDLADRAKAKLEAYDIEEEVMKRIAQAMVGRVRRSIAIGPHVGGFGLIGAKDSVSGGGISFGLGLYTFDVPTGLNLREVIKERVKEEVKTLVLTGGTVEGDRVIKDLIEKVVRDVLDGAYGSQTFQRPKMSVVLEGQATLGDADGFGGRLAIGFGFSKLSIGLSASVLHAGDTTTALFGPELSIRLTPIGEKRTPVFDLFARGEVGARSELPIQVAVGARVLLDIL